MLKKIFGIDSNFTGVMEKLADLVILSVLWIVSSLPVITLAASTSALYYTVVKCIRRGRGTLSREFFGFFRSNWRRGIGVSLCYFFLGALAVLNIRAVGQMETGSGLYVFYKAESLWVGLLFVFLSIYLFPVFSRFEYGIWEGVKMSLLLSVRHIIYSLIMTVIFGGIIFVGLRFFAAILFLPAFWMLILSYLMERIFVKYMKEPKEGEAIPWYWEGTKKFARDEEEEKAE